MPRFIEPMKATLADRPFRDEDWLFEVKWDGYRVEAVVRDGKVRTCSRATATTPRPTSRACSTPPTWIEAREAIVDGEVVALDDDGRPGLRPAPGADRRRAGGGRPVRLVYQAFDLLYLDGRSLLDVPLEERKRLLGSVLRADRRVRYAGHVETEGVAFFEAAEAQGLEGIVAKHRRSPLRARPRVARLAQDQGPARAGAGRRRLDAGRGDARRSSGAVVVGVDTRARPRCGSPGKVGLRVRRADAQRAPRRAGRRSRPTTPPFDPPPPPDYRGRWGGDLPASRWVRPELVIRAEIGGWTRDGPCARRRSRASTTGGTRARWSGSGPSTPRGGPRGRGGASAGRRCARPRRQAPSRGRSAARAALDAPPRRRPSSPRSTRLGREGTWRVGGSGAQAHQPRQGPVPAARPAMPTTAPVTKRDLIALLRPDRAGDAAAPRRPAAQPPALPQRRRRPGLLAEGHPVDGARAGSGAGARPASESARTANDHLVADRVGDPVLARQPGRVRDPRLDVHARRAVAPDVRPHRHRPRHEHDLGRDARPRPALPDRARAPRRPRLPQAHRPARHPGLDPGRARRYNYARDQRLGREAVAGGRARPCRTSSRGSGRRPTAAAGPASTTPRTRRSRRSSRRTPCGPRPARPSPRRSAGRSWTTRTSRPTAGRSGRSSSGSRAVGDLFAGAQTDHQVLPPL